MNTQQRTQLYIITIGLTAAVLAALTGWLWPLADGSAALWYVPVLALLIIAAARFPIKISRQAEASLVVVPVFMAVLLLHPLEATIVTALGTLIAEKWMRAPYRAVVFNTGVNSLAAVIGGITFYTLSPGVSLFELTQGHMLAAGASGAAVYVTNFSMVVGMVTIRKGMVFWSQWRDTFALEAIQEGGLLSIGLISVILISLAWWAPILVAIPAALAYFGFSRIVGEAAEKTRMAEELENSIRELKEIQAQLIQTAKMTSVGSLATGIAHEINNPVFAISGRADLLLKGASKHLQSEKAVAYVQNIQEMAARISNITRHLMEYAQTADDRRGASIPEVIEASLTLMGKQVKTTRIIKEYDASDPIVVECVPSQLQQVFLNLVSNAIEAIPDWGSVTLGCRVEDDMAVAYVKDTGSGIPDEIRDRLFEPFVTTKDIGSRIGMGTGLYTCHRIVEAHGGNISIETEAGKGTTVWIRIPLAQIDDLDEDFKQPSWQVAIGDD